MPQADHIRTAQSTASEPQAAVAELRAQLGAGEWALVVFFCSPSYASARLADALAGAFAGIPLIGCTTAGEIGPAGYLQGSIVAAAFPASRFRAACGLLRAIQEFEFSQAPQLTQGLRQQLADGGTGQIFGLLLVDGLSMREEAVTHALQATLQDIPLVGGSAGDDLHFAGPLVYHDGRFHRDAAVLALVRSAYPFRVFKSQHFIYRDEKLVVTAADAPQRVVHELNGLPAAAEYARLIGCPVAELTPQRFAASPVVVLIDGTDYVRSIQKANPDGSLTFYSAIEVGLVLRVATAAEHLVADLSQTLDGLRDELGAVQALFAFDCVLRTLEIEQQGLKTQVGQLFREHHTVGFSTYGEQFGGVHVNQTLTGIAIGARAGAGDD